MIFRQVLHPATGCASYFFGCTGKKELAVCDRHIDHVGEYLALADAAGAGIGHVFETHVQADHVSGALELVRRSGAKVYLHEAADVDFPHVDLRDGDQIELGNDYVRVLHTPGHSDDSVCYLVGDRTRGPDPWFVLTGDTLFVGSAGRPDLHGDEASRTLAGQLPLTEGPLPWGVAMVLLGVGTAMVYPTLLAAISDVAHPEWRASAVGVYRLWRDGGYAVGALTAGLLADAVGVAWTIGAVGALTFASGAVALARMYETLPSGSGGMVQGAGASQAKRSAFGRSWRP